MPLEENTYDGAECTERRKNQKRACRSAGAILDEADYVWTDEPARISECVYQRNADGSGASAQNHRRKTPEWRHHRVGSDENERERKDLQDGLLEKRGAGKANGDQNAANRGMVNPFACSIGARTDDEHGKHRANRE